MHPTEVYVKVPGTKRKAAEFVSTKIISPRNNTTVTEVYGDIAVSYTHLTLPTKA